MMRYRTRSGIVLLEIQGTYLLAAERRAKQYCPYVTELNETGAAIFELYSDFHTTDEIAELMKKEYEIEDPALLEKDIVRFTEELYRKGYLVQKENQYEISGKTGCRPD